ncbi:MAG: hypothetical protein Kow0074_11640 [Candidatus Zixiibacteriota bacterium]
MSARRLTTIITTVLIAVAGLAALAQARSIDIVLDQGTVRIDGDRIHGVDYIDLRALLGAFGARVEWDPTAQRLRADLDGRLWVFWGNSALVSVDGEVGGLGDPVVVDDDRLLAPLQTLSLLLTEFSGMSAYLVDGDLHVRHREFSLYGYEIEERTNGTLIDLRLSGQPPYEVFVSEGNYINLTLHRTIVKPSELNARRPHRMVLEVRANQFDSSAQISFRMREPFDKYVVSRGESPGRLTIQVGGDASPDWAAVPPTPVFDNRNGGVDRIVIDPGHGGDDHGAKSLDGVIREKDVTLTIAERLSDLLEGDRRFEVIMTRDGDYTVPDAERIRLGNVSGADLFLSLHATGFESEAGRGCQTFFYGEPLNDRARIIMADVNVASDIPDRDSEDSDLNASPAYGRAHQHASAELARLIQSNFEQTLPIPSRGVGQGEFHVLDRVDVPGVVVCVASVANLNDEGHLRRRSFQRDIAKAIADAIVAYRERVTAGPISLDE